MDVLFCCIKIKKVPEKCMVSLMHFFTVSIYFFSQDCISTNKLFIIYYVEAGFTSSHMV